MYRHDPIPIRPVPLAALLLAALALGAAAQSEPQSLSDFKIPEYNEKMQLESMLFGDHAQVSRGGKVVDITNVKIEYYKLQDLPEPDPNVLPDPDAEEPAPEVDMRITAPHCTYDRRFKAASSPGSVRITAEDMAVTGEDFNFKVDTEHLVIRKNVKVVLRNLRNRTKVKEEPAP
jgi:hypothetical protein